MRLTDIDGMLGGLGIPVSYYQFPEATAQEPPFLVWYIPGSADLYADNINYANIVDLTVELYTDYKDFALEMRLEALLAENEIAWSKTETWIQSEKMWQITYSTEVLINE